ncbi:transmembrane protein 216-like isoform X1 [Tachypleus tridentatus]|uniref:transmembrane protein 216-like isoform X1 n=1 Tax=Tachypleus tridentatus TaxID=6853 RepID=UPI003FD17051
MAASGNNRILSSLPYQILLVFGGWYYILYSIVTFLLFVYKGLILPYPVKNVVCEVVLLTFLCGVEGTRLFLGKKGNLTERTMSVILSLVLTVPAIIGVVYFLRWQTYVLWIELILGAILLVVQGLQSVFGLFSAITFARAPQLT